jgi:hypothetical protein
MFLVELSMVFLIESVNLCDYVFIYVFIVIFVFIDLRNEWVIFSILVSYPSAT